MLFSFYTKPSPRPFFYSIPASLERRNKDFPAFLRLQLLVILTMRGDDGTASKTKIAAGQYTHWARPKWIRMYTYNYEFGESYYRPQVRYASNSRYSSELSSSYSVADSRRDFSARRRASSPPRAMSFIERWSADPFYGRGFMGRSSSLSRAESSQRESSMYRSSRAESMERESSQFRSTRAESSQRQVSQTEQVRSTRASSELRSRRAQSEYSRTLADNSHYASDSLLQQINNVRATSIALQEESAGVQARLRDRRARSLDVLRRAEADASYGYTAAGASDDCLVRSDALDSVRRSRREQSILSDIESRYSREGSVTEKTGLPDNYDYPRHHLVCNENCPFFNDPAHHRRFVIGNRYTDAAALGGFDVLFDPTVHKKTRHLLSRLSEERDVESSVYQSTRESSMERGRSSSRYAYNTIY